MGDRDCDVCVHSNVCVVNAGLRRMEENICPADDWVLTLLNKIDAAVGHNCQFRQLQDAPAA